MRKSTVSRAGGDLRLGWTLPGDYGTSIIRPGGDTNSPPSVNDRRLTSREAFGFYFFCSISGRLVLRDIFLDGNSFSRSHSIDKTREILLAMLSSLPASPYAIGRCHMRRLYAVLNFRANTALTILVLLVCRTRSE